MAGVAPLAGVGRQMALMAELRWRLFWNSLRTWRGRLELTSRVLLFLLAGLFVIGIGFGLGRAASFFIRQDAAWGIEALLWVVFGVWQLFPWFAVAATTQFEFRGLLRFPLRFPAFFLLSLSYGLFDPAAVVGLVWLGCIGSGICLARPGLLPTTGVVLGFFAAMNVLLNRVVFSWLERWLARRRTREVLGVVLLLGMVLLQLAGPLAGHWIRGAQASFQVLTPLGRALPPGLAANAILDALRGHLLETLGRIGLLAVYGAALALLLGTRLRAQYRGEDLSEAAAPRPMRADLTAQPGWQLPGLSGRVAAVAEKEFRYLLRSGQIVLNLALPLVLIAFFALSFRPAQQRPEVLVRAPEMAYPIAVGYALLILTNLIFNSFAFEGRGIQLLLFAPVRFREILLAKNFVHASVILLEAAALYLLVALLLAPPGAMMALNTLAALLFALLVNFTVGNLLSLRFPRRMESGGLRRQRHSGVTVLANLIVQFVVFSVAGFVFFWTSRVGPAWAAGAFLGLCVVLLPLYTAVLRQSDHLAARWREGLLAELSR